MEVHATPPECQPDRKQLYKIQESCVTLDNTMKWSIRSLITPQHNWLDWIILRNGTAWSDIIKCREVRSTSNGHILAKC
jgi:hypothetical protein